MKAYAKKADQRHQALVNEVISGFDNNFSTLHNPDDALYLDGLHQFSSLSPVRRRIERL